MEPTSWSFAGEHPSTVHKGYTEDEEHADTEIPVHIKPPEAAEFSYGRVDE
jgi:hypothetical protein